MITILRFILFFLLAPLFVAVMQAAGAIQDDFRIVDAGFLAESVILENADGHIFNYDSSGALLQQCRSLNGKAGDEDDPSEYGELKSTGAAPPPVSILAGFVAAKSGVPRVRHYTAPEGMAGIKAEGAVNPARGGGVHVETGPPFGPARTGAAETGAYGKGAYVEFDAPGPMSPTHVGPRKTAVIPTDTPLPITDLNPTFKTVPWWKFWAR